MAAWGHSARRHVPSAPCRCGVRRCRRELALRPAGGRAACHRPAGRPRPPAPAQRDDGGSGPAPPTPTPAAHPNTARRRPGKGPACPALRCTSVLVTGDMLVHAQLWEQAQQDAAAAGKPGLDFGPLLEGQRAYIEQQRPRHLPPGNAGRRSGGPVLGLSVLQCSAADHRGLQGRGLPGLHHGQQPHHRPRDRRPGPDPGCPGRRGPEAHRFLPDRGRVPGDPDPADRRRQDRRHRSHLRPERAVPEHHGRWTCWTPPP